jgi:hypothetical protein
VSIVATVKVYDGVVLGTESMTQVTSNVTGTPTVIKAYEHARKLFRVGRLNVGVMTYGAGNLGNRSIESFLHEFSRNNRALTSKDSVEKIAARLADFIAAPYNAVHGSQEVRLRPILGCCVAGYSDGPDQHLASEWEFQLPEFPRPQPMRPEDHLGASWRGVAEPFSRLWFGIDPRFPGILESQGASKEVIEQIRAASAPLVTAATFDGMPVQDAIHFCKFIIQTTIGWAKYAAGTQSCGGPIRIAVITKSGGFEWVDDPPYSA